MSLLYLLGVVAGVYVALWLITGSHARALFLYAALVAVGYRCGPAVATIASFGLALAWCARAWQHATSAYASLVDSIERNQAICEDCRTPAAPLLGTPNRYRCMTCNNRFVDISHDLDVRPILSEHQNRVVRWLANRLYFGWADPLKTDQVKRPSALQRPRKCPQCSEHFLSRNARFCPACSARLPRAPSAVRLP